MIPTPYKILGILLIIFGIVLAAEYDGASRVKAKWDKEKAAQAIADSEKKAEQATETVKVVTKYVNRIIKVKDNASGYQQAPIPDTCQLSADFRLLHDSAALNIPYPATGAHGTGPTIEAATVARIVAANYATCHESSEQLTALQDWVTQMGAAE